MPRRLKTRDIQPSLSDCQKSRIRAKFVRTMSDRLEPEALALALFMLDQLVLTAPTAAAATAGMTDLMRVLTSC